MSQTREQRPKPFWRSVGYLLFALGWGIVFAATTVAFVAAAARVAMGAVGPFHGVPVGGLIIVTLLGAPTIGYVFFLSPLLTATQAALGFVLFRDSIGGRDSDPPLAVNTGRRIPVFAAARPSQRTARLQALGDRARLPGVPLLLGVFGLGALCIAAVILIGWK